MVARQPRTHPWKRIQKGFWSYPKWEREHPEEAAFVKARYERENGVPSNQPFKRKERP